MGLELKNKVKKEKEQKEQKGKFKRKRDVFGKRLTRFGIIALVALEVVAFGAVKIVVTMNQNKKQTKIDEDIANVNKEIKNYNSQLKKKAETYENVGNLIATLPTSFDQQAASLDLDRMVILSGLSETGTNSRSFSELPSNPFEFGTSSIKTISIRISLSTSGNICDKYLNFIDYLSNYKQENFYYIQDFSYSYNSVNNSTTGSFTLYTFYNDVALNSK